MRLVLIYFIFFPFFLFPPGSLQIADIALLLLLFIRGFNSLVVKLVLWIPTMVIVALVSCLNAFWFEDFSILVGGANILYSIAGGVLLSHAFVDNKYTVRRWLLIFSIVYLILGINSSSSDSLRQQFFFNNPNQLAFYGLVIFYLSSFDFERNRTSTALRIIGAFFVFYSVSQSGIGALFLVIFYTAYRLNGWRTTLVILMTMCFLAIVFLDYLMELEVVRNIQARFVQDLLEYGLDGDNGAEGRNFNRVWERWSYLFFGAGESGLSRFGEGSLEIHNSVLSFIFSFGIFGTLSIIFLILRKNLSLFALLILSFTMMHHVYRWPLFWMILSIEFVTYNKKINVWNKWLYS